MVGPPRKYGSHKESVPRKRKRLREVVQKNSSSGLESDSELDDDIGEGYYERKGTRRFESTHLNYTEREARGKAKTESANEKRDTVIRKAQPSQKKRKRNSYREELEEYAVGLEKLEKMKELIAGIALRITADPSGNVKLFAELREIARKCEQRAASLAILTEVQLFKDISPAYMVKSIPKDDRAVQVSKEVARTRTFERELLNAYRRFLASMRTLVQWRGGGGVKTPRYERMKEVRRTACIAVCDAIKALIHFNEAEQLVAMVTQLCNDRDVDIRKEAGAALGFVLSSAHKSFGSALNSCVLIVQSLAKFVLQKKASVAVEVIEPLLATRISLFHLELASDKKEMRVKSMLDKKAFCGAKKSGKRRKSKRGKAAEEELLNSELERDLKEAEAEASPDELSKAGHDILHWTCQAYFDLLKAASEIALQSTTGGSEYPDHILRRAKRPPRALGAVLDGLLRISPIISLALVEALLAALTPLLEHDRLPLSVRFRCISASYSILSTHAASQNASASTFTRDTHALDKALYISLESLFGPWTPVSEIEDITKNALSAVVAATCHRQLPLTRASALSKRLTNRALFSPSHGCAIGLLIVAQPILPSSLVSCVFPQAGSRGQDLLGWGGGMISQMNDDAKDPDVANAERSAAWELSLLMSHWHPEVRRLAQACASGNTKQGAPQVPSDGARAVAIFTDSKGGFNPVPFPDYHTGQDAKFPVMRGSDFSWPSISSDQVRRYWRNKWDDIN